MNQLLLLAGKFAWILTLCFIVCATKSAAGQTQTYYSIIIGLERINAASFKTKYEAGLSRTTGKNVEHITTIARQHGHRITLLLNEAATRQAIIDSISAIAGKAGPADRVMIYFSGPGDALGDDNANRDEAFGIDQVWVAYDGYVRDDDITRLLHQLKYTTVLMIVDGRYNQTSVRSAAVTLDFSRKPGDKVVPRNESNALNQKISTVQCKVTARIIDEEFKVIYMGAYCKDYGGKVARDGSMLTHWLYRTYITSRENGTWKKMTTQSLACALARKLEDYRQQFDYHEIGIDLQELLNKNPFKL